MVDDVQDNLEPHQQKGGGDTTERLRSVRERREAEQRRRLDELRAHAAAAQAQREQRDQERRARTADQRAREDERRVQVEERKRAIWEAGVSRREALLRRDREREERIERQRAARSSPGARPGVFAFGSSTPRMLEPADTGGIFWGHRSTNPLDQMNFFESLASSTSNVMFTSAPLTRRSSTYDLDHHERDKKDECSDSTPPVTWSSVARRRTDLVPTIPAPRPPGRAYSMTRLDRIQPQRTLQRVSPSMSHLAPKNHVRSGETTPGSRPGSAMSQSATPRRPSSTPRRPRPASIAGTPRGVDVMSMESTPTVSRDATSTNISGGGVDAGSAGAGVVVRRPHTARRPRPASMHATPSTPVAAGDGKPPLHRKPKAPKDHEKTLSRTGLRVAASPADSSKEPTPARDLKIHRPQPREPKPSETPKDTNQVNAAEVTQKLEALQLENNINDKPVIRIIEASPKQPELKPDRAKSVPEKSENNPVEVLKLVEDQNLVEVQKSADLQRAMEVQISTEALVEVQKPVEVQKADTPKQSEQKKEDKQVGGQEKAEETDMTASMIARSRITTEEEAKAALAERRRKAREELERQAELERQRAAREAEEAAERRRAEEELERQLEEEARELAELRRTTEEQKLREAIEAQQQLEREAREKAAREELERVARLKEEEAERIARVAAEAVRKEEAEREEAERKQRKQRVEAIMLRTRQKKAEEDKKQQEIKNTEDANNPPATDNTQQQGLQAEQQQDNGNGQPAYVTDLLGLANRNSNTGRIVQSTVDLIEAERNSNLQNPYQPETKEQKTVGNIDLLTSNVDLLSSNVDLISQPVDSQSNVDLLSSQLESIKSNGQTKEENGYKIHNGLKENNGLENVLNNGSSQYPLTLHNAV